MFYIIRNDFLSRDRFRLGRNWLNLLPTFQQMLTNYQTTHCCWIRSDRAVRESKHSEAPANRNTVLVMSHWLVAAPTISGDMERRGAFEMRDDLTYNISETVPVQSQKKLHGLNRVNTSSIILNLTICNDILLQMFGVAHVSPTVQYQKSVCIKGLRVLMFRYNLAEHQTKYKLYKTR